MQEFLHAGPTGRVPVPSEKQFLISPGDDKPRLDPAVKKVQPGTEWMKQGVSIIFARKYDSAAIILEAIEDNK